MRPSYDGANLPAPCAVADRGKAAVMAFFAYIGIASCIVSGGLLTLALYLTWRDSDDWSDARLRAERFAPA